MVGGDQMRPKLPRQRSLQQEMYRDIPGPAPSQGTGPGGIRSRPPLAKASSIGGAGDEIYDAGGGGGQYSDRHRNIEHNISSSVPTTSYFTNAMQGQGPARNLDRGQPHGYRPDIDRLKHGGHGHNLRDYGSFSAPEDPEYDGSYNLYPRVVISDQEARDQFPMLTESEIRVQRSLLDPNVARVGQQRKKLDSTFRNDSLSSDQSEYQTRPPPPRPHKHKKMKHQRSMSSSDEEIRSTPDCTSCGEEFESESISEKEFTHAMMDRFHREELLDAKIKNFLAHPVSWQPNSDGSRSIGHMILTKSGGSTGSALLGLKVVGGKLMCNNRYGAVIEKVKKGSIADTVGNLLPGDEVLEWNGRSLQEKSYEEVHDIIAESRQDDQVELIVARTIHRRPPMRGETAGPTLAVTDPLGGTLVVRANSPMDNPGCRLQVKTVFNQERLELIVTVLGAVGLSSRVNGQHRNPYAKIFLLPGK